MLTNIKEAVVSFACHKFRRLAAVASALRFVHIIFKINDISDVNRHMESSECFVAKFL